MAGRKRVPTKLKLVKGTAQPSRMNKKEPKPDSSAPRVPSWVPRSAHKYFLILKERLERVGLASKTYTEMMGLAAQRLDEIAQLNKFIDENGATYVSSKETDKAGNIIFQQIKANPAVSQRNDAMKHLQSLLASFGLSPADISKASGIDLGKRGNKFSEL